MTKHGDTFANMRQTLMVNLPTFADGSFVSELGAFEMINLLDDLLPEPLDWLDHPCFQSNEAEALTELHSAMERFSEALQENTWCRDNLEHMPAFLELERLAGHAAVLLAHRRT
jgi:hypothetical protein